MCKWGDTVDLWVTIPTGSSYTGKKRKDKKPIDRCISDLVAALELSGIVMRGSCCGHGKDDGEIHLDDGRVLKIITPEASTNE